MNEIQTSQRGARPCSTELDGLDGVSAFITPLEATNTGPGLNQGSGGGARGRGFEERVVAYARTEGGRFLPHDVCLSPLKWQLEI